MTSQEPDRYRAMFEGARGAGRHVTVPFFVVGDPGPGTFLAIVDAAVGAGADALELGIPFSDPVADGPAIQAASQRALRAGTSKIRAFALIAEVRTRHPSLPIGLLVYANLVVTPAVGEFFKEARIAGLDSVLIADVPMHQAAPFREAADREGIALVLIAPPNAQLAELEAIAQTSRAYVYIVSRAGVTGAATPAGASWQATVRGLRAAGSPPCLLGFGVSTPEHVRSAVAGGASGVICGSAFSVLVEQNLDDEEQLLSQVRSLVQRLVKVT